MDDIKTNNAWNEVHQIFLHIGDALMAIGTKRNMSEDWYGMVDRLIDHGIDISYKEKMNRRRVND